MSRATLIVLATLLVARAAFAQESQPAPSKLVDAAPCRPQTGGVRLSFHKAGLGEVLDGLSRLTCMRFILSEGVKSQMRTITIVTTTPVPVPEASAVLLGALEENGLELVRAGAFWRVLDKNRMSRAL